MERTSLVTGGSGYFGSLLVKMLLEAGEKVRVLDLFDADDRPTQVEFHQGDIRDREAVRRACQGVDTVHHNVAQVPLARNNNLFWSVNRDGARALFDICHELGVKKVINMSSSAIFGVPESNPVTEDTRPAPREDYGRAKVAAEAIAREYVAKGLDITTIRPRTILGSGRLGIMQILFEWIRMGRNVPVMGNGDNTYQFVHAKDLASASILAATQPGSALYNIGAESFGTMRETLEAVTAHANTGSRVVSVPEWPAVLGMQLSTKLGISPLAPYHWVMYGRSLYFDVSKAKSELGWAPAYSNSDAICESYDWYLENRDAVLAQKNASKHRSAVRHGVLDVVSRLLRFAPPAG